MSATCSVRMFITAGSSFAMRGEAQVELAAIIQRGGCRSGPGLDVPLDVDASFAVDMGQLDAELTGAGLPHHRARAAHGSVTVRQLEAEAQVVSDLERLIALQQDAVHTDVDDPAVEAEAAAQPPVDREVGGEAGGLADGDVHQSHQTIVPVAR